MKKNIGLFVIGFVILSVILSGCINISFDQTIARNGSSDYKVSYDFSSLMLKSNQNYENQTQKNPCENVEEGQQPSYACSWDEKGILNLTTHFASPDESNSSYTFTTEEGLLEKTYKVSINKLDIPRVSSSLISSCSVRKSNESYLGVNKYTCKAKLKNNTVNLEITSKDENPFTVTMVKCGKTIQQVNKTISPGATEKFTVKCPSKTSTLSIYLISDEWESNPILGIGYSYDIIGTTNNSYTLKIKNNRNKPLNITYALCMDKNIYNVDEGMEIAQNPNMSISPGQESTLTVNCINREGELINIYEEYSTPKIYLSSTGEKWDMKLHPEPISLQVRVYSSRIGDTSGAGSGLNESIELGTSKGKVTASGLKMINVDMQYTLHMPGDIVNATPSQGLKSIKGNTVTYDILEVLDSGEKITVKSREISVSRLIILVGIFVLITVMVILLIGKKSKDRK
ncbi:hypothetical protein J7J26_00415 [Candidatus Micrarchaeota archaeon]|nr:hypothetical protein [Candidatus Micrarchaeota archaeon]